MILRVKVETKIEEDKVFSSFTKFSPISFFKNLRHISISEDSIDLSLDFGTTLGKTSLCPCSRSVLSTILMLFKEKTSSWSLQSLFPKGDNHQILINKYIYIYIYIYVNIIIMLCCQHGSLWPSLATCLNCPLLPGGLQGYILYWHRF